MNTPPPQLPASPGVYKFFDYKGQLLYVGKAKNIAKRIQQYFTPGSLRKQEMVATAHRIERIETPSEADALLLEDNLIKEHLPEYNKLLRNNSSYVFLKISTGDFPTFRLVKKRAKDRSTYVGPRYNSKQLWQLLRYLRQVFKFHAMKPAEFTKGVLSSDYFFGLDKGWNIVALLQNKQKAPLLEQALRQGRKQEKTYEEYKEEYKKITQIVRNCFEGKTGAVLGVLEEELRASISKEHFERCATLRDIHQFVSSLEKTYQHIVLKKPVTGYLGSIERVADARVILLVQITEGKVIDIIRTHKATNEHTVTDLAATLYAEFGCTRTLFQDDEKLLCSTPSLAKLPKKELASLQELLATAQDSYLQSTAHLSEDNIMDQLLLEIQSSYELQRIPLHMECIDISHHGGSNISGGLSCFRGGLPDKMKYRQYKIQTVQEGSSDDYQSLKEVLIRRCKLTKENIGTQLLPDLLILDGGKGQLGIIRELAKEYPSMYTLLQQIDIVALGKGEARQRSKKLAGAPEIIWKFGPNRSILEYPVLYTHADQLIIKLRDEAHRFANRYRKKQEEKQWT